MRRCVRLPVAAPVLCLLLLTACGGGDPSTVTGPSAQTSTAAAPAANAPADPVAAEAQVRAAWEAFFDGSAPPADKLAHLESAEELSAALAIAAKNPAAAQTSATVSTVSFTSPTTADVTYALSSGGTVVLPQAQGTAVLQDGAWKVSKMTFCQLTGLSAPGTEIPGCR